MRFILIILLVNLSSCWAYRAFTVRNLKLTDHTKLPSVVIEKSTKPFHFQEMKNKSRYKELEVYVDSLISETHTAAFLIIRNDTLIYEKYFMGFDENSMLPSNSMAKSFTGTLVGIALLEGAITSDREPITNYLPELVKKDKRFSQITIRHLLDMRSGLDFREYPYSLKSDAVRLGFRPHLVKHIFKAAKIREAPGRFKYQSINTQLLGLIVERATNMSLQDYLQKKLWESMGAEHDATWNVDSKKRKHVIISAAINATARDFAKLGRVYLNNGVSNTKQVVGREWVRPISNVDTMEKYDGYKNQWWNRRLSEPFANALVAQASKKTKKKCRVTEKRSRFLPAT